MADYESQGADGASTLLDDAEAMIWALLDGQLDEAETRRLERLIETNSAVLGRYIECLQLETELRAHFDRQAIPGAVAGSPAAVLSSLATGAFPAVTSMPPVMPQ